LTTAITAGYQTLQDCKIVGNRWMMGYRILMADSQLVDLVIITIKHHGGK